MRIRPFRYDDIPEVLTVQCEAARVDGTEVVSAEAFEAWLRDEALDAAENAFVITDDDDELSTWSQAGTLEGVEGEIAGYTLVRLERTADAYHFICQGAVMPQQRRRRGGRLLLVGALNRARVMAYEFDYEAEQAGTPIYFEVLLPTRDEGAPHLAALCELEPTDEPAPEGFCLYRREL
ncbi:hypothetical protein [Ktedonobacter racemifer]|uniref:N-acetyltransferase domain-containing protein n=1 Tax=Ktedonobacter racemifer DSM 44963 TaxID=485913 RepID=D6U5Z7_KTERA|nr:hypothetical protein [Ktedonobacter racemifer]EFH80408.1 hypothetical protein Krac_1001 [Ktedonobacter racemifer DSM 44963]